MRRSMRRTIPASLVVVACLLAPAHARAQSVDAPADTSAPATPLDIAVEATIAIRDSLVAFARAQIGRRYVFGGESPEHGFDCSGLVQYILAAFGVELPRTAAQQARIGESIDRDPARLRPGDLLTFGDDRKIEHIGIYVGGGRFVHASSVAGRVIESPLQRPRSPLIKPWAGVRRVDGPSILGGFAEDDGGDTGDAR